MKEKKSIYSLKRNDSWRSIYIEQGSYLYCHCTKDSIQEGITEGVDVQETKSTKKKLKEYF